MYKRALNSLLVISCALVALNSHAGRDHNHRQRKLRQERAKKRKAEKAVEKRVGQINWAAGYQDLMHENGRFFKRLFKRHDEGKIIGVELVIASSSWANVESGLGHTLLRFVDNVGSPADDVVLSFVANQDSAKLNYFKGIFGGYPVFPQVRSLRLFMQQYNNSQQRDLDRYIILSDKELRDKMISKLRVEWNNLQSHLKENQRSVVSGALNDLKAHANEKYGAGKYGILPLKTHAGSLYALSAIPTQGNKVAKISRTIEEVFPILYQTPASTDMGDYTFFSNNCAGALVNFMKDVGYPHRKNLGFKGRIPLALPDYFKRALTNPYPVLKIKSLRPLKEKVVDELDLKDEKKLVHPLTAKQTKKVLSKLNINEARKLSEVVKFENDAFDIYRSTIKETDSISFEELFGIYDLPNSLYEICTDSACANEIKSDLAIVYPNIKFKDMQKKNVRKSKWAATRRKRDHRSNIFKEVSKTPYKGLLVNEEILEHQKNLGFLHENWN